MIRNILNTVLKNKFPFLLLIAVFTPFTYAYGTGKDTLSDVTGIAVIVDEISDTAREDGLKETDLKSVVEGKLQQANIEILEERKWFTVFGGAYLLIKVTASKSEGGGYYAVYLDVELYQTVVLFGKKLGRNITTAAATWSVGKLLSCPAKTIGKCVEGSLSELADMFIEDYKSVNTVPQ